MLPHPVGVAVAPALPLSPVETGLNRLDFTCVVLDVEGRGPDIGVGVFLEPLHLASEALVERESGATRADTVQGADTGPGVGRPELSQHGIMIGCGGAAPLCLPGHGRTVGPALGAARCICTALARPCGCLAVLIARLRQLLFLATMSRAVMGIRHALSGHLPR